MIHLRFQRACPLRMGGLALLALLLGGCPSSESRDPHAAPEVAPPTSAANASDQPPGTNAPVQKKQTRPNPPNVVVKKLLLHPFCHEHRSDSCFQRIEGGTFWMGAQPTDPEGRGHDPAAQPHEGPVREVTLSPYSLLVNTVTARNYRNCLQKGACREEDVQSKGGSWNVHNPRRVNHPVNGVSWEGARRYCDWVGGRLPTEAEWEFAARGTDGRRFAWGDSLQCGHYNPNAGANKLAGPAAFGDRGGYVWNGQVECVNEGTTAIPDVRGKSPFGIIGQAGNVWEWVADWYAPNAYATGMSTDPKGPATGDERVQRGGGWANRSPLELRAAARGSLPPDMRLDDVGIRCARDLPTKEATP